MGFILTEHGIHHTFVNQNRFWCSWRSENQLRTGIGFAARYCRTDTLCVVGERVPRSFVVHHLGQSDTAADNGCEGVNASGGGAEGNPNQRLLCRVGELEMFPFSHHAQIVPGIFPPHPPHFMLIQPGNEGTVFVVTAAVVQHPVKPGHSADANGRTGVHVDFSQKLQLREGAGVVHLYSVDKACLHSVAPYRYDTARMATPTVGDYATIRFDRNEYSVPVRFLRKPVTVKGYANKVVITCDHSTVVTYERLSGQGKTAYKLEHYIGLLEQKPRSVFQAKPVRQNVKQELLDLGRNLPGGNKDMVRLLRLCVDYGEDRVIFAKNRIPDGITPTVDIIRSYLEEPEKDTVIRFQKEVYITQTDLAYYDEKCGVAAR